MGQMKSSEIRQRFLDFFIERDHRLYKSSSLIPHNDPTVLLTTAGMQQFINYFTGQESAPTPRAASAQKCFRTADIEEVGDPSHLTFFEMLGNFSIADYFKKEAVSWAWDFLTNVVHVDRDQLWATVYEDDDEAFALWLEQGVPEHRILRYTDEQGNFWASGETGPCGPCSELHYDFGVTPGCPHCADDTCHP